MSSWQHMWIIALSLYAIGKVFTLASLDPTRLQPGRSLAYFFLFPGMNAAAFCGRPLANRPFTMAPFAAGNILLGSLLLWGLARTIPADLPLVRGWAGMIGFVLLLHFGLLQWPSILWQRRGFDAPLLMNQPLRSKSVAEFWSVRWNTAFRQLSHQFVFRPLAQRAGVPLALMGTFAFSGIVHDLVISLPARAGWGLPTLYFLFQGAAVLFERACLANWIKRHPLATRVWAAAVVAVPTPLLFHPPFVQHVFLPFMSAIGALPGEHS